MGKGTDMLRTKSESDRSKVANLLSGLDAEGLADLKAQTIADLPANLRPYYEKSDPAKDHLLRVLMWNFATTGVAVKRRNLDPFAEAI